MLYNMCIEWRQICRMNINIIYNNSKMNENGCVFNQKVRGMWQFCDKNVATCHFESVNMSECLFL